jgi:hypothetical protein
MRFYNTVIGVCVMAICLFTNNTIDKLSALATKPVLSDVIGVTHVGGKYFLSNTDFLNEGADQVLVLGSHVIKVWLTSDYTSAYPYHSNWPTNINALVDLVKTPYYRAFLAKPFTTVIFETIEFPEAQWSTGLSFLDAYNAHVQFYNLAQYLLNTYQHTGKTFVIQNWEADNELSVTQFSAPAAAVAINGLTDYLNTRQDAVSQARKDLRTTAISGVNVVNACEFNQVPGGNDKFNHPLVIDQVVPQTHCDLYSYSSWGTNMPNTESSLTERLNYIATKAPPSALYGHKNIMLGEFGANEKAFANPKQSYADLRGNTGLSQRRSVELQLKYALNWGVVYAIYWQLYDNDLRPGVNSKPGEIASSGQLQGFWLIRPDGSHTPTWDYLHGLFAVANGIVPTF